MKIQCQASPARTQDQKEVRASICADLLHEGRTMPRSLTV